jgi:hypothetical protein
MTIPQLISKATDDNYLSVNYDDPCLNINDWEGKVNIITLSKKTRKLVFQVNWSRFKYNNEQFCPYGFYAIIPMHFQAAPASEGRLAYWWSDAEIVPSDTAIKEYDVGTNQPVISVNSQGKINVGYFKNLLTLRATPVNTTVQHLDKYPDTCRLKLVEWSNKNKEVYRRDVRMPRNLFRG